MNFTTILASLIALLTGFVGGATYTKNTSETTSKSEITETAAETVNAEDFISVRPALASLPSESLSETEKTDLLFMREEEKLARDVYQTLYEKWNVRIFSNIAQSEQTHTETIRDILEKYDVADPVTDDSVGVFQNKELQNLYNELTKQGLQSEMEALQVGAKIEELDISDLQKAVDRTDNQDIKLTYENLTRASRNHLRVFTNQLENRGGSYEPEYISADMYQNITAGDIERGNKGGHGGQSRGWSGR
jgi:hypothetical protein